MDVIILGLGPAAVTAAVYLKRFNRDVMLIGNKDSALMKASDIENYYGFSSISGQKLFDEGLKQLKHLDIPYFLEEVLEISCFGSFEVKTNKKTYHSSNLVLATGKARNKLNIKGANDFEMRGLSYCAVCDGFFFKNKKIGIIGNGAFMLHELEVLERFSKDITIFTNGLELENNNHFVVKDKIIEFYGDDFLRGIKTTNSCYDLDGVFVAIGSSSTFDFIKHLGIAIDKANNIIVNDDYETNIKGLYAIGDAIGGIMQITKACYDGMRFAFGLNKKLGDKIEEN